MTGSFFFHVVRLRQRDPCRRAAQLRMESWIDVFQPPYITGLCQRISVMTMFLAHT